MPKCLHVFKSEVTLPNKCKANQYGPQHCHHLLLQASWRCASGFPQAYCLTSVPCSHKPITDTGVSCSSTYRTHVCFAPQHAVYGHVLPSKACLSPQPSIHRRTLPLGLIYKGMHCLLVNLLQKGMPLFLCLLHTLAPHQAADGNSFQSCHLPHDTLCATYDLRCHLSPII